MYFLDIFAGIGGTNLGFANAGFKCVHSNDIIDRKYYYNDKPLFKKLQYYVTKYNTAYQWRRQYVRENKSGVCPTLTANMGTGGHNVPIIKDKIGIRKLTPRECARLQGFPDSYILPRLADSHLYKQIGNSVTVPIVYEPAKRIQLSLNSCRI